MYKIKNLFNRIIGSISGILAWIIGLLSFSIAIILRIKIDPNFSLASNYLCDLGIAQYDSHVIFSIGCIFKQIFLIPFYISFGILLQKKIYKSIVIKAAIFASIIYVISLIIVVPFLLDPYNVFFSYMHGIFAFTYFSFGTLAFTLYGIIELSNPKISNFYAIISFIAAFMQILTLMFSKIYLIEWFAIAGDFIWLLLHAIFLFKYDASTMENTVFFELDNLYKIQ